jgi:hypothetical protein
MLHYGQKIPAQTGRRGKPTEGGRNLMPFDGSKYRVPELKIKSGADLKKKIDTFEDWCKEKGHVISWASLAVYLGVTTETLRQYRDKMQKTIDEKEADRICDELTRARAICEMYEVDAAHDKNQAQGAIFCLKNNHGYTDRQDLNLGSNGVRIEIDSTLKDYTK